MSIRLSASKLGTAKNCSYLYFLKYVNFLPDESGVGANRGTVTHKVLECLLRPDRKKYVDSIVATKNPFSVAVVERLTMLWARKLDVAEPDHLEKIKTFILTGVSFDFYCEGSINLRSEEKFEIDKGNYILNGRLDVTAEYPDRVVCRDFKTSRAKYNKEDIDFNLQALTYSVALKHKYPHLPIEVDFVFLKYTQAPFQKTFITDELREGFLAWLDYMSEYLTGFDYKKATSDFAKNDIKRKWLCGGQLGELNKDGDQKWYCAYKYPFVYWAAMKDEKIVKSSRNRSDLEYHKNEGCEIVMKTHSGCPAWKHLWEKKD